MKNLTHTQNLWIDNLVNREGMTEAQATIIITSVSTRIMDYEDIQNLIFNKNKKQ
jgi:hypothetical protein